MRILVANDDGVNAPGVRLLADAARAISADVWIVAPERKWTAASHQLTFDRTLTLSRIDEHVYACSGAPADCVIAAMTVVMADEPPALVLAGINDKANVGEDLAYSGTTAIAREGAFWGVPAISVSRTDTATGKDGRGTIRQDDRRATGHENRRTIGQDDGDAIAQLLAGLWSRRALWAQDGCWLGVNLPAVLPAPLATARVSRDKIGSAVDILERSADRIAYRLRRGRPGSTVEGDENARLAAGAATVLLFCWNTQVPLADGVLGSPVVGDKMAD